MKRLVLGMVAAGLLVGIAPRAEAGIFGWLFGRRPAPAASAPAGTSTRSYSYQPGSGSPVRVEPGRAAPPSGFRDAGAKIRGEY
jgi:hypothetical protein